MKNPHEVKEKINKIISGGKNKLQIIFDFDRTLTKHHENGVLTKSSFGKSFKDFCLLSLHLDCLQILYVVGKPKFLNHKKKLFLT